MNTKSVSLESDGESEQVRGRHSHEEDNHKSLNGHKSSDDHDGHREGEKSHEDHGHSHEGDHHD